MYGNTKLALNPLLPILCVRENVDWAHLKSWSWLIKDCYCSFTFYPIHRPVSWTVLMKNNTILSNYAITR